MVCEKGRGAYAEVDTMNDGVEMDDEWTTVSLHELSYGFVIA